MRRVCATAIVFLGVVLLGVGGSSAGAQDAPPSRPPAAPRRAPELPGVHWEPDFVAGSRRGVVEGRPVYFCVNALLDDGERGNVAMLAQYDGKDMGDASRALVCFVCNGRTHEPAAGGTDVCGRYRSGTCECHAAALAYVLERWSADGESVVSPSHHLLDPDGERVYHGDFMESVLSARDLERWLVRLSPRIAVRRAWTVREGQMAALGKAATPADLEKSAREWVGSKDPFAVAALVAVAEQEADVERRDALLAALAGAGGDAVPVAFDSVDAIATDPDLDEAATLAWLRAALRMDATFGGWAAARILVGAKSEGVAKSVDREIDAFLERAADPAAVAAVRGAGGEALAWDLGAKR